MKRCVTSVSLRVFRDTLILTAVPLVLIIIHYAVPSVSRRQFHFTLQNPSVVQAWTAAYLHTSWRHLAGNVGTYAVVVPIVYAVFWRSSDDRRFWGVFAVTLLVTPLVTAVVDFVVRSRLYDATGTIAGFSGVTNAYTGVLLGIVALFVSKRVTRTVGGCVAVSAYLLAAWLVVGNLGIATLRIRFVTVVGMVLVAVLAMRSIPTEQLQDITELERRDVIDSVLVVVAVFVFILSATAALPADAGLRGVNILAHVVGLVFGLLVVLGDWSVRALH